MAGVRLDAAAGRGLPERADSSTFLAASPAAALAWGDRREAGGRQGQRLVVSDSLLMCKGR
jgi:hypothetical protein